MLLCLCIKSRADALANLPVPGQGGFRESRVASPFGCRCGHIAGHVEEDAAVELCHGCAPCYTCIYFRHGLERLAANNSALGEAIPALGTGPRQRFRPTPPCFASVATPVWLFHFRAPFFADQSTSHDLITLSRCVRSMAYSGLRAEGRPPLCRHRLELAAARQQG